MLSDDAIAATGSRPKALVGSFDESTPMAVKVKRAAHILVHRSYERGYRTFYAGMAQAWDTWVAEAVLAAREQHPDIRLLAAVPFMQMGGEWPRAAQGRWRRIVEAADEAWLVEFDRQITAEDWQTLGQERPFYEAYGWLKRRNKWMVDRASAVLSAWDGFSSGTEDCLNYAYAQAHIQSIVVYFPWNDYLEVEKRTEEGLWGGKERISFRPK